MSKKSAITKIVLNLGSREITMTVAEAKELFNSLEEFFGKEIQYSPIYIEPRRWWWTSTSPYWYSSTSGNSVNYDVVSNTARFNIGTGSTT